MTVDIIEVKEKVNSAIENVLKNDQDLLKINVHERTVCHKFAEYLQHQFSELGWTVDVEYNRKGFSPKILHDLDECHKPKKERKVIPDIIIHHRNKKENLLVIEMKTNNRNSKCDEAKLSKFTLNGDCKYDYGLFIRFRQVDKETKPERPDCKWFENGKIIS